MRPAHRSWRWLRRFSLAAVAVTAVVVSGQQPPAKDLDKTKVVRVEKPTAAIVRDSSTVKPNGPPAPADLTKSVRIEKPAAAVVRDSAPATNADANPKVEPGKVKWHATLDDARAASAKTGKPVLLLHMMGKLDLQFC